MAMAVEQHLYGIDVSKAELVICDGPERPLISLSNDPEAIAEWLRHLPPDACLALEATNTYHLELLEQAHGQGHIVYVIDGYRLNRYRESVGGRAKTDASDARLLRRYLERERTELRPWSPPSKGYRVVQQLLHRRAALVQTTVALRQSLSGMAELKHTAKTLARQLAQVDTLIHKRLLEAIREFGWDSDFERCQTMEGVGPVTAAALCMAFRRGQFRSSDAFVAFLGLDVRVRESGTYKGRRRLSKQGDPELRRLLYLAAMTASRSAVWKDYYQRHLGRGLSRIQALVVLARKLARVAFALLKNQSDYTPKMPQECCSAT
jgi:transposase